VGLGDHVNTAWKPKTPTITASPTLCLWQLDSVVLGQGPTVTQGRGYSGKNQGSITWLNRSVVEALRCPNGCCLSMEVVGLRGPL